MVTQNIAYLYIGLLSGFMSGMFGIGGGSVRIPLLNLAGLRGGSGGSLFTPFLRAMRIDVHRAIATSLFVTIFTAIPAVVVYWHRGDIIWLSAVFVLIGSVIGAKIASRISLKTKPKWLEMELTTLVTALAFITIYKAL